jgi:hypothetical protein
LRKLASKNSKLASVLKEHIEVDLSKGFDELLCAALFELYKAAREEFANLKNDKNLAKN